MEIPQPMEAMVVLAAAAAQGQAQVRGEQETLQHLLPLPIQTLLKEATVALEQTQVVLVGVVAITAWLPWTVAALGGRFEAALTAREKAGLPSMPEPGPPTPAVAPRPSPRSAGTRRPVRAAATIRDGDDDGASTASSTTRRSSLVASFALVMTGSSLGVPAPSSAADKVDMRALTKAFEEAMSAGADYDAADAAWTKAINIAPLNSAGWSNRGTKRLQAGRWRDARDDLERSVELASDPNNPDALTLNNLGNAEGALGNWDAAMANYLEASKDPSREMESIALANLALAKFQVNDVDGSLRVARNILRKDPEFWDVRALATAVLWADGREEDAEAEWQQLCRSGRGFGASNSAEDARKGGDVAYAARLLEQQVAQQAAVVTGKLNTDVARKDGRDAAGEFIFILVWAI